MNPSNKPSDMLMSTHGGTTKNLNGKKSPGPDEIPNFVSKNLTKTSMKFILAVFNNCINNGYFPNIWKIAKIFPIRKKGNFHE